MALRSREPEPFLRRPAGRKSDLEAEARNLLIDMNVDRVVGDRRGLLSKMGRRGDVLRALGDLPRAMDTLREALALAEKLRVRTLVIANRLRLATATFYAGDHEAAEDELSLLIRELESRPLPGGRYLDYTWQHLGKCVAEQHRYREAITCFERALQLREGGAESLIASSIEAIALAKQRMIAQG